MRIVAAIVIVLVIAVGGIFAGMQFAEEDDGPAERAGEAVDEAVGDVEEGVEEAGDDLEDAGENIGDGGDGG